jgi:predicted Ser/Thr protein kinase
VAKSRPSPTAPTVVAGDAIADAVPAIPTIDLRVAQSKAEAALFGASEAVRIGRYRILERVGAGGMGIVWSAWDPELGRAVALKLASSGDAEARALARDEARALARLSHPNVVPIYDVLDHDDRVLLVMELIKGESLRAASKTRSPAQIIRDYRQAGDGLAAAHAAGLIHRDFKPDNALLGADGRVRVLDFGLAHDAGGGEGVVAGTPGYMAPEQERGEKLTPAVDQFALCVALREALTARGGVPRWLQPVLARGTAGDPAARYPTMAELLAALALDPATRWRRRALVGGGMLALAGAAGAFLIGRAQHGGPTEAPCSGGPGLIAASWGPARRAEIAQTLTSLTGAYARDSAPHLLATLDRYAGTWLISHRESCRAHARKELSSELLDRRTACLGRARAALAALADLSAQAADADVAGLVQAASALPDLAACTDDTALLAGSAPGPAIAAEVRAVDDALARIDVERDAGRVSAATSGLAPLLARATATGYAALEARAQLAAGRVAMTAADGDLGAAAFAAATQAALAADDDALVIEAWARHAWSATMVGSPGAVDGRGLVEGIAARVGERGRFARALLHNNLGVVAMSGGDRAAALREFGLARDQRTGLAPRDAAELGSALENLVLQSDDLTQRQRAGEELLRERTAALGAHHPLTLQARIFVGLAATELDAARRVAGAAVLELARYHPELGGVIADLAREPALLAAVDGDVAQVRQLAAAVSAARAHGAADEEVAMVEALGAMADGHAASAAARLRALAAPLHASATAASPWWHYNQLLTLRLAIAVCDLAAGQVASARSELTLAAALLERVAAPMPRAMGERRQRALAQLQARLPA